MNAQLNRTLSVLAITAALAASALGADIDGKWKGSMPGRDGNGRDVSFDFKASGATLNGKFVGPQGRDIDISDGKLDGDLLSFKVAIEFNGSSYKMSYTGRAAAGEIHLKMVREGAPRSVEFTLKRAGS